MNLDIVKTPQGHFVLNEGKPIHNKPASLEAAIWLRNDMEGEPDIPETPFDMGELYQLGCTMNSWTEDGLSREANVLLIAMNVLGNINEPRFRN